MNYVFNDLGEHLEGLEREWSDPDDVWIRVDPRDAQKLVYAAYNTHECAVSRDENERILKAARAVSRKTGVGYTFDEELDE